MYIIIDRKLLLEALTQFCAMPAYKERIEATSLWITFFFSAEDP